VIFLAAACAVVADVTPNTSDATEPTARACINFLFIIAFPVLVSRDREAERVTGGVMRRQDELSRINSNQVTFGLQNDALNLELHQG
jgi:hypothetical protein